MPDTSNSVDRPKPPPLPQKVEDYRLLRKTPDTKNINDMVEQIHLHLWDASERYRALLEAIWDSDAVEGSLDIDDMIAAQMIREEASTDKRNELIGFKNLATIVKCMRVVQRRYQSSRSQRRYKVGGQDVKDDNGEIL